MRRRNSCGIWKVRTIPRRNRAWAGRPVMSWPSKRILPSVGGRAPATMLKMVLLPAPFGPMIPVMRSASTWNEQRSTAVRPPKRRVSASTARMGGCGTAGFAIASMLPILARLCRRRAQHEQRLAANHGKRASAFDQDRSGSAYMTLAVPRRLRVDDGRRWRGKAPFRSHDAWAGSRERPTVRNLPPPSRKGSCRGDACAAPTLASRPLEHL